MSKSKFIRLSGWALLLGAIAFFVAYLIDLRDVPPYHPNNFLSRPIDLYFEYATSILIPGSLLLFLVGMTGLFLRYRDEVNIFGKSGLIIGIIGGVLSFAGSILLITESEPAWTIFIAGFLIYFIGLVIFGVATLRDTPLPRWKILPILTGIWFPLQVLIGSQMNWSDTVTLDIVGFLLTAVGLAGLGYLLQSDSKPASSEAGTV